MPPYQPSLLQTPPRGRGGVWHSASRCCLRAHDTLEHPRVRIVPAKCNSRYTHTPAGYANLRRDPTSGGEEDEMNFGQANR